MESLISITRRNLTSFNITLILQLPTIVFCNYASTSEKEQSIFIDPVKGHSILPIDPYFPVPWIMQRNDKNLMHP